MPNNTSKKPSWIKDLKQAYSAGYKAGYFAHKEIPNRFGTRRSAINGFSSAIKTRRKSDKLIQQNKL